MSLGVIRCVSLLVIALVGVLGRMVAPETGGALPDLAGQPLIREWGLLYSAIRQAGILAAIVAVLVACAMQVREEVAGGTLVIAPLAVLAYLALPAMLPADAGAMGAVLAMMALFAVCLGAWTDLQPDDYGRPAFYSALGVVLALVVYVGGLEDAAAVPRLVMGADADPRALWGLELLAVLVAPAALTILPGLKLAWNRSANGVWWN